MDGVMDRITGVKNKGEGSVQTERMRRKANAKNLGNGSG